MKIVITGATGFVGLRLLRALAAEGHDLVALTRSPEKARSKIAVPCAFYAWDALKETPPAEALVGADAVVHLAGEGIADSRWTAERKKVLYASRIEGTRNLVEGMSRMTRKPSVFLSASAIGYYGDRDDEVLTEKSAAGTGFLATICRDWESAASGGDLGDTRRVILRIGAVLGEESGALAKLIPVFQYGLGGPVGDGKQWMSWIHADDLVALIRHVLSTPACIGTLNATSPEPVTNGDFSKALGKALGRFSFLRAPAFALKVALGEMAVVVLGSQRVIPEKTLTTGFRFRFPGIEQALGDICDEKKKGNEILRFEQWVPRPVKEIFPFFAEARNLEEITPPWLNFKVEKSSTSEVEEGSLIDYRLKIRGVPARWRTRIEEWKPNERFVDTQLKGPYALWHHTHDFIPTKGGTLLLDTVRYRLPLGKAGKWAALWYVKRDVRQIFGYRKKIIEARFGQRSVQ